MHLTHDIFRILPVFSQFLWNLTFIFSDSIEKFSLVLLQKTHYIFRPWKCIKECIFFKLFWYKVFVHRELKWLNFLMDSILKQFPFGDHLITSHNLFCWWCMPIVRRTYSCRCWSLLGLKGLMELHNSWSCYLRTWTFKHVLNNITLHESTREVKMAKSEANVALIGFLITLNISKSSSFVITSLTNGCFSFTIDFVRLSRDG